MAEINLDFTVDSSNINVTVQPNDITFTPSDIQLNLYATGSPTAGISSNGELLFNNQSLIDGVPNTSYANGNLSLGNVSNLKIGGGTNGYILQTDGTGNLSWTVAGSGGGNGIPGGSNTQIQYNDSGLFGGTVGFSFDKTTGDMAVPGNITLGGTLLGNVSSAINANYANYAGNVVNATQSNITSLGTLTSLAVTGMTSIQEAKEKVTINSSPSTGTVSFDVLTQAIFYKSANASSNFTLNIRGNNTTTFNSIINDNESITITFINTNGTTGYYANVITIDGASVTPIYPLSVNPNVGTANGKDVYTYNIIKLAANTYTVFGSRIGFS